MEREKTKRWLERQLISDPGSVEDKRSVCVDRGEREDGGERRKSMCTSSLVHSFFFTGSVRFRIKRRGHPLGPRGLFSFFFFFLSFSRFFSFPSPLHLALPPRFDPLYAPVRRQKNGARARARQDKRDDRAGRHPVNLDNEQDPTGVRSLLENGLITVLALRN